MLCPHDCSRISSPPARTTPRLSVPCLVVSNLCSFSEDSPYFTGIFLEDGAAGKTDIDAIVVMDGISNAKVRQGSDALADTLLLASWTLKLSLGCQARSSSLRPADELVAKVSLIRGKLPASASLRAHTHCARCGPDDMYAHDRCHRVRVAEAEKSLLSIPPRQPLPPSRTQSSRPPDIDAFPPSNAPPFMVLLPTRAAPALVPFPRSSRPTTSGFAACTTPTPATASPPFLA